MSEKTLTPDIPIHELLNNRTQPLLSYEFFPPKSEKAQDSLLHTIDMLKDTDPDFVTVTYGAGGSTRSRTLDISTHLQSKGLGPVMPHLTCVGSSKAELRDIADEIYDLGFRSIMTLRGDAPKDSTEFVPAPDGLRYANELVELLKAQHSDFCCGVAGYPESHPESTSAGDDLNYLKQKVDAGADFITTQLFFDNDLFFDFCKRCESAGINVPILPGLLPATSLKQVERFTKLCGATFPDELRQRMEAAGGEGVAAEDVGIQWCLEQAQGLLAGGVAGIHLYVLNKSRLPIQLLRCGFTD